MNMLTEREMENIVEHVLRAQDAAGVLMVHITRDDRAEVIAAFDSAFDMDLPTELRRLACKIEEGQGRPTGRHKQQIDR